MADPLDTGTLSEADMERAIRAGCTATDIHLRCSFPECGCKQTPTIARAAIAAMPSERDGILQALEEPDDELIDAMRAAGGGVAKERAAGIEGEREKYRRRIRALAAKLKERT